MNFRPWLLLLAVIPLSAAAAEPSATPPPPGLLHRVLHPFGGDTPTPAPKTRDLNFKSLEMGLTLEPAAPRLSEDRAVKVTVTLTNKGKKLLQLDFPTTQRIEVQVKNRAGKMVVQWSEDQSFTSEPTLVAINPGERLEYTANVSTRDLVAGESYTVEAFFPNFEALRQTHGLAPVK